MAYLAVVHAGARGGGEERAGRGHCSPGSGHRGAAARPLDVSALTRWGTRTPARGPATAPGLAAPLFRPLARSVTAAAALRKEERAQTGEERESRRENDLGFSDGSRRRRFSFTRRRRTAVRLDPMALVDWASVAAQVGEGAWPNSWPRPRLRPGARGRARERRGERHALLLLLGRTRGQAFGPSRLQAGPE